MTQVNYGGYLLPEIPVIDGYRYILIRKNNSSGYFDCLYSPIRWWQDNNVLYTASNSNVKSYRTPINEPVEWVFNKESVNDGGYGLDSNRTVIYTNRDILDGYQSSGVWMHGENEPTDPHAYSTIESIFEQTIDNLTCLVNNTAYDDNSYTITSVPSWIKFNNIAVTSIKVNGNSWICFDGVTENIKFNRRDAKMYYLWVEEGKLYNYYNFYRIRWKGYSHYSGTSQAYLQEWEVIIFDTGDICIHAINIPSIKYDGKNEIVASRPYTYTRLTAENRFVTFYSQDENNTAFIVEQSIINLAPPTDKPTDKPNDKKYLIRSGGKLYTIAEGALSELSATEATSSVFRDNGANDIPDGSLLVNLVDPEVLYWINSTEYEIGKLIVTQTATPPAQVLYSPDYDMSDATIKGIEKVIVEADEGILFAVSFDSGTVWNVFTGTEWGTLSEENTGMTATVLNAITSEQWQMVATTGKIKFRISIHDSANKFTSLVVDYIN